MLGLGCISYHSILSCESAITMTILLIISLLSPIHSLFLHPTKTDCKSIIPNWMLYTNLTQECWSQGKVLFYPTLTCHPLHSTSPCDDDGRLVFSKSPCAETVCRAYKDNTGRLCPYPSVSHNGECADPGDAATCGSILGRRLVPDVLGDYSCKCDRGIGFVEYSGSCHAEYLQGPCEKGEQVVVKEERTECVMNRCKKGEVMLSDGDCYPPYEIPRALFNQLTSEEITYFGEMDFTVTIYSTFDNCHNKDTNGKCPTTTGLPIVHKENYLTNLKLLFPEISSSIDYLETEEEDIPVTTINGTLDLSGWSDWTSFSECSKPCGVGKKSRERVCGGSSCTHAQQTQERLCNVEQCCHNLEQ